MAPEQIVYSLKINGRLERQEIQPFALPDGGVFETMRLRRRAGGSSFIAGFELHCSRFQSGLDFFGFPQVPVVVLRDAIQANIFDFSKERDLVIRMVALPDDVQIVVSYYSPHPWRAGVRLCPIQCARSLPQFKHGPATGSIQSNQQAQLADFDTALLHEPDGTCTECSWANFFWLDESRKLRTSATAVLPGITRELVTMLFDVHPGAMVLSELYSGAVQGAFISQATSGLVPVLAIGSYEFSKQQFDYLQSQFIFPFEKVLSTVGVPATIFSNGKGENT